MIGSRPKRGIPWFKHYPFLRDPDVIEAIDLIGHHALTVFIAALEVLTTEFVAESPHQTTVSWHSFQALVQMPGEEGKAKITAALEFFQGCRSNYGFEGHPSAKISFEDCGRSVTITCEKFACVLDDNARRRVEVASGFGGRAQVKHALARRGDPTAKGLFRKMEREDAILKAEQNLPEKPTQRPKMLKAIPNPDPEPEPMPVIDPPPVKVAPKGKPLPAQQKYTAVAAIHKKLTEEVLFERIPFEAFLIAVKMGGIDPMNEQHCSVLEGAVKELLLNLAGETHLPPKKTPMSVFRGYLYVRAGDLDGGTSAKGDGLEGVRKAML